MTTALEKQAIQHAYQLRLARWLGLDLDAVITIVDRDVPRNESTLRPTAPELKVSWEAIREQTPRHGRDHEHSVSRTYGEEHTIHHESVRLDWSEIQAMRAVVGERP